MKAEPILAPGAYSGLPAAGEEIFGAFRVHFHEFSSQNESIFYNTRLLHAEHAQLQHAKC
jgi:hypothetical protein